MKKDMEYYIQVSGRIMKDNLDKRKSLTKKDMRLVSGSGQRRYMSDRIRIVPECSICSSTVSFKIQ